jgi:hypothetical protein
VFLGKSKKLEFKMIFKNKSDKFDKADEREIANEEKE